MLACALLQAAGDDKPHWAFQPLQRPGLPAGVEPNPVDRFVGARLARSGKTFQAEAGRRTLIRRLSFDLRGLPPSPAEVTGFVADARPDAFEQLVERFLASPQYGERWGRHWLDIVAYADSNGYFNADSDRPLAWRYRDYVVRSIAADKPLDRFIQEQIAGDELAGYVTGGDIRPDQVDPLVATHLWRNVPDGTGESDGNPLEVKVDKYAVLEGNVQLFGSAFLGLTLQCARCHEHKFEPVPQEDYYALEAILRPGFEPDRWLKPAERVMEVGTRDEREANHRRIEELEQSLKTLKQAVDGVTAPFRRRLVEENLSTLPEAERKEVLKAYDAREKDRTDAMKAVLKSHSAQVEPTEQALFKRFPALAQASAPLHAQIKSDEAARPKPLDRIALFSEPTNAPSAHHLLIRGSHAAEGKEVPPGFPAAQALGGAPRPVGAERAPGGTSGRRLALARWVTSEGNPLLPRVMANRVWHHHFGEGLVPTLDNLGRSGARPSDPALLDWLAVELRESGWSLKHLHRVIVTSRAYRQMAGDPLVSPRRLDAEEVRDAMLAVSGELDLVVGGPAVPTQATGDGEITIDEGRPDAHRRSLYLQHRRTHPVDLLATFDGPAFNPVCIQRMNSTVALQSLSLLNSDFVRRRAKAFAHRVAVEGVGDPAGRSPTSRRVEVAFEMALGRPPTHPELDAAGEFLGMQSKAYAGQSDAADRGWTDFCQMLMAANPFLYVD
jgi:hypothetical protein